MGTYQSTPLNIISGQNFDLSITTFTPYYIYTNYTLVITTYTFNTYIITNNGDGTSTIKFTNVNVSLPTGTTQFVLNGNNGGQSTSLLTGDIFINPVCYLKGTKILCYINDTEQYINIEDIKQDMLIKTYLHGYKKIKILGYNKFKNTTNNYVHNKFKLYKLSMENNKDLIEDLYVSGQHSFLVDEIKEQDEYLKKNGMTKIQKIDDKFLLLACEMSGFEVILDDNEYELFQIILEDHDIKKQYGIWANGLLSETMSYNTFHRKGRLLNYYTLLKK